MGSSVMRINQLAGHMRRYYSDQYETRVAYVSRARKIWVKAWIAAQPHDTVYVFSKHVASGWSPEDFDRLRRKSLGILVDYVDLAVRHMVPYGVDAHLATSYAGAAAMQARQDRLRTEGKRTQGGVHVVLHNYDAALDGIAMTPPQELAVAYFGTPGACPVTPHIAPSITVLDAGSKDAFDRNLNRLGQFNCHYCARSDFPDDPDRTYRPFTKGITAAACNAVVLTNRNVDDAVRLLGSDYPYMLDDIEPATLDEGFRFLQETYRGQPWNDALDRVMTLKDRTSHRSVAGMLHNVVRTIIH